MQEMFAPAVREEEEVGSHGNGKQERNEEAVAIVLPPVPGEDREKGNAEEKQDKRAHQEGRDAKLMCIPRAQSRRGHGEQQQQATEAEVDGHGKSRGA